MGLRGVSARIQKAAEKIDVEINPYVIAPDEFSRRMKAGDHFLNDVMASAKRFLKLCTMALREDVVSRLRKKYPTLGLAVEDPPA